MGQGYNILHKQGFFCMNIDLKIFLFSKKTDKVRSSWTKVVIEYPAWIV